MSALELASWVGGELSDVTVEWELAMALVNKYVGTADVPAVILDRCYTMVGQDLFLKKDAPNGVAQFSSSQDGISASVPMRISRDPLASVRTILSPWVLPW